MVAGRAERRAARRERFEREFGRNAAAALDVMELTELAWHDCCGEPTVPDSVLEDMIIVAGGDLGKLVTAARLAVTDWRDLRLAADDLRR